MLSSKKRQAPIVVPPEGAYREGVHSPPKPLWQSWWEEKRAALKLFWRKAYRVGKVSAVCLLVISLLSGLAGGCYYLTRTREKEIEAVITGVSWSCHGYIEMQDGKGNKVYYRSKALHGEGLVAKCPPGIPDNWIAGDGTPMYAITFWVQVAYTHGGYANETVKWDHSEPINGIDRHSLKNEYRRGTHWLMRKTESLFWKEKGTSFIRPLP